MGTKDNFNCITVTPVQGKNPRTLYEHQIDAMKALDGINQKSEFSALLVLPTGGGKTLTAVNWLLKNAVDKGKKVIWIAHRQLLLEQAADTFKSNAYTGEMVNHTEFTYRIISGVHDKPIHIKPEDNILIVGKDSIVRKLDLLDKWLQNEDVYLVVDEAHHAVAKSYKKIIEFVKKKVSSLKLLGLTATPFRTSDEEKGALKQIFTDDIVYKTDLQQLIDKTILAYPYYDECETKLEFSEELGLNAIKSIENFDVLPENLVKSIAGNAERNRLIVEKYLENHEKYGPTIVFTVGKDHAIALNKLFNEKGKRYGVKSEYIVSDIRDQATGITISSKENDEKIKRYKNGEVQVLINVNILTEGTDLPLTHTVFLTRPTVSTVLMTQMVGRALRGTKAGGTKEAYIVSFIDNWNDKIAWVNPQSLTDAEFHEKETDVERRNKQLRLISIEKIEEFVLMADESVDTSLLERISMIERIPLGYYILSTFEWNHQILVYNSTQVSYENLINDLSGIMRQYGINDEVIPDDTLKEMTDYCMDCYFDDSMIPACKRSDVERLLEFYAQKEVPPLFNTLDEIDRKKLDVSQVAKKIYDEDMSRSVKKEYIDSLWNEDGSIIPMYYTTLYFFKKQIDIELDKLDGYIEAKVTAPQTEAEKRKIEEFSLQEIIEAYPKYGIELKEKIYRKALNQNGRYVCNMCGKEFDTRRYLQIDHIKAMDNGGLTVEDNLQVLCRWCNTKKGAK